MDSCLLDVGVPASFLFRFNDFDLVCVVVFVELLPVECSGKTTRKGTTSSRPTIPLPEQLGSKSSEPTRFFANEVFPSWWFSLRKSCCALTVTRFCAPAVVTIVCNVADRPLSSSQARIVGLGILGLLVSLCRSIAR